MARRDDADEFGFRVDDVGQRLPGLGLGKEDHEVDRVPGLERDADFGVLLEAADARTVSRARIDDDERAQRVVDAHAARRNDSHQRVVDRALERSCVGEHLPLVIEERRLAGGLVREIVVAALTQRVPEQHRALRSLSIAELPGVLPHLERRRRRSGRRDRSEPGAPCTRAA